ncbi:MAG: response regulator [Planctomycetota bacterium]|jgi:CheY-like chemotaxis protein
MSLSDEFRRGRGVFGAFREEKRKRYTEDSCILEKRLVSSLIAAIFADGLYLKMLLNLVRCIMGQAKILVVDDDQDIRDSLQAILEGQQYTVATAADRAEGMEKIKTEEPDLLILDVMMSAWQDGFEMARELKKDSQFRNMPILMLTGVKDKTGIDFKSAAGDPTWCPVDGFLEKPVEPEILLQEVGKLLSKKA